MAMRMRIYLVRHGESLANVDQTITRTTADHTIPLSPRGLEQARVAGAALRNDICTHRPAWHRTPSCRVWTSPYVRARQTAEIVHAALPLDGFMNTPELREDIALAEQQFGLFDGVPEHELPTLYPNEHAHYKKLEDARGRFWARLPCGESRFDVVLRVHQMFGTIQRDYDQRGVDTLIIVAHGVTIRAFVMRWCHKSVDWFESEKNPKNCSIRLIDGGIDCGYIHEGGT